MNNTATATDLEPPTIQEFIATRRKFVGWILDDLAELPPEEYAAALRRVLQIVAEVCSKLKKQSTRRFDKQKVGDERGF